MEAAVFAKAQFKLQVFEKSEAKLEGILKYLDGDRQNFEKTLIVASSNEEVSEICLNLGTRQIACQNLQMESKENVQLAAKEWDQSTKEGDYSVLVLTDAYLRTINISSAQNLIHYSLPNTFDLFADRFACCLDFLQESLADPRKICSSLILLDGRNNVELPRLMEFWKTHETFEVPPALNEMLKKAIVEKDRNSVGCVCPRIFDFGECLFRKKCTEYRHGFNHNDVPIKTLPSSGQIKFKIVEVLNLKRFVIQIQEVLVQDMKWVRYQHHLPDVHFEINNFLSDPENQVLLADPAPGVVCALKVRENSFERALILKTMKVR
jgi:hypothetical protein